MSLGRMFMFPAPRLPSIQSPRLHHRLKSKRDHLRSQTSSTKNSLFSNGLSEAPRKKIQTTVTLENIIGGGFLIAATYWLIYRAREE